jgi:hypothetical protein
MVVMCAPYSTIKDNRFKIKLMPGSLKKGKAARNILHLFMNSQEMSEGERAMLKKVPEMEVITVLLGNVKLAGTGLLKMEQKEKANKKQKVKESEKKEK